MFGRMSPGPEVVLYGAPECCLCETLKEQLRELAGEMPFRLTEVDISGDPELEARFRTQIPVLFVEGRKVVKYRVGTAELRKALMARS